MDVSTKSILDHIAGLRGISHGMGDYDADAMQALLDDRDNWVRYATLALQEKLAAEDERDTLRQKLHNARDEALEEAAAKMDTASIKANRQVDKTSGKEKRDYQTSAIRHSFAAQAIRALKGDKP